MITICLIIICRGRILATESISIGASVNPWGHNLKSTLVILKIMMSRKMNSSELISIFRNILSKGATAQLSIVGRL